MKQEFLYGKNFNKIDKVDIEPLLCPFCGGLTFIGVDSLKMELYVECRGLAKGGKMTGCIVLPSVRQRICGEIKNNLNKMIEIWNRRVSNI